jgi:hypothetical protein
MSDNAPQFLESYFNVSAGFLLCALLSQYEKRGLQIVFAEAMSSDVGKVRFQVFLHPGRFSESLLQLEPISSRCSLHVIPWSLSSCHSHFMPMGEDTGNRILLALVLGVQMGGQLLELSSSLLCWASESLTSFCFLLFILS